MKVNGNVYSSPVVKTESTNGTVRSTAGDGTEPTDDVPLVGDGASEPPPPAEGDVPSPSTSSTPDAETDPAAYAAYLQQQLELQDQYQEWDAQLAELEASGDPKAAGLRSELQKKMWSERDIEKAQEWLDNNSDYLPDADVDGDGIENSKDRDKDGDGLTTEAEAANGTSDYSEDSDGDGITDRGEIWLSKNDSDLAWLDPTNADANNNGQIDSLDLPASITVDGNGNSIRTGGAGGTGGSDTGTGGVSSTSNAPRWSPPSEGAQQAAWGGTYEGGTDVVINGQGENVSFAESADHNDLIITNKDTGETITVKDYKNTKIYLNGTLGTIETNNLSGIFGGTDTNKDGYADAGIKVASTIDQSTITTNNDYFGGAIPKIDGAEGETTYDGTAASGTFSLPSSVSGKVIEVTVEGEDVIIKIKDSKDGEATETIRVKGGKGRFVSGDISFQLPDSDTYFISEQLQVTVHGGSGNDVIIGAAGSKIYGEGGHDDLRLGGDADGGILDGGTGDDILQGSDGVDTLNGGAGNDAIYSGAGKTGDTLNGGTGDDVLIVQDSAIDADYNVDGGAGIDMSNYANTGNETSVEVQVGGLKGLREFVDALGDNADDILKDELDKAAALNQKAAEDASQTVRDAFLAYMMRRTRDNEKPYAGGGSAPAGFGDEPAPGDVTPPPEEEIPTV